MISNSEFEAAYENIDNQKIMRSVCKKYKTFLSSDVLHTCRLHGLWKCLIYHKKNDSNIKFTTSLFNYVKWECQKEIQKYVKSRKISSLNADSCILPIENTSQIDHVKECLYKLQPYEQTLIKNRYFDGMTLKEISLQQNIAKETVRQRINKAVKKLKKICYN
jgi:RNA polymerase sigma factor (sigma-70 family)